MTATETKTPLYPQPTTNQRKYAKFMARAADGDRKAARALLLGEWWISDPDSTQAQDTVINIARNEHKYQSIQETGA